MKRSFLVFTLLVGLCLTYVVHRVVAEECTHVPWPCDVSMALNPDKYCCLSVNTNGCRRAEGTEIPDMIPILGVSCGARFEKILGVCICPRGYCGGPQCDTNCESR